jgi:hypothetical protein
MLFFIIEFIEFVEFYRVRREKLRGNEILLEISHPTMLNKNKKPGRMPGSLGDILKY